MAGIFYGVFPGFGLLIQLIFFGLFIYIIYWLLQSNNNVSKKTPKEILKERLAKGEITKEEYKELLKEIEE
jgi:putative membrane protein